MKIKEEFIKYIESKGLNRGAIWESSHSVYADVSDVEPNKDDFTQVTHIDGESWGVRLAKKDMNNELITNGFFKTYKNK